MIDLVISSWVLALIVIIYILIKKHNKNENRKKRI